MHTSFMYVRTLHIFSYAQCAYTVVHCVKYSTKINADHDEDALNTFRRSFLALNFCLQLLQVSQLDYHKIMYFSIFLYTPMGVN